MKFLKITIKLATILFVLVSVLYPVAIYSDIPFVRKWRTIYIETAMTTYTHKWLATAFIPEAVIDDVMNQTKIDNEMQNDLIDTLYQGSVSYAAEDDILSNDSLTPEKEKELFFEKYWEIDTESFHKYVKDNPELIEDGYSNIYIDNSKYEHDIKSVNNERIYLLDAKNNLIIFEITGSGYAGKLATIKNPSQVVLEKSKTLGNYGTLLRDFYNDDEDTLLTINCSGFGDQDAGGNGGTVVGSLIIDGKEYGKPTSRYFLFGQKFDDKFYIEKYDEDLTKEYRWAAQFNPALVVNGQKAVNGSFGYGIQPRSAVGQAQNGDMLLLIIDGRQVGYSIGATVSDLADILLLHDAYQANNLDGGSSALMWYDGKNITKPSSTNYLGRYLPDAIVVKKAK